MLPPDESPGLARVGGGFRDCRAGLGHLDLFSIDFLWYWPGWPIAGALSIYALLGALLLQGRGLRPFSLFTSAYVGIPVVSWCIANPSYGSSSGWAVVVIAALAIVAAPLVVVATPMLILRRAHAPYLVVAGGGLIAACVSTFAFFSVAHHIGCSIARIDCL